MANDSKTPNILMRTRFYPPKPNTTNVSLWAQKRAFYSCNNTDYNVIDYLSRESATQKNLTQEQKEQIIEMQKGMIPEKDILNYISNRPGANGLFSKAGMISKDELKIIKERLKNSESIIWEGVISFESQYGKENCNSCEQALALMQKTMPAFLKHSHLDNENIEWLAGFHTNTDNYHIQFIMFEKEPQHIKKSGDLSFSSKGQIATHNFANAKLCIEKELSFEKDTSFEKRQELRSSFSKAIWTQRKESLLENDLTMLANNIPTTGRISYNSENMKQLKPMIDKITTKMISNFPEIKKQYNDYKKYVVERKKKLESIYFNNNIKTPDKLKNYVSDRIDDVFARLGNITIQTAQALKRNSLKFEKTKTQNPNTKVYRNNKKLVSFSKATSTLLALSSHREESEKAFRELRKKLEENEELEIQLAKLSLHQ